MKNVNTKIFWCGILAGIVIRFVLMSLAHNFDFDSYCIVGDLAAAGKNIYANTSRYNYGPVWFTLLGLFWRAASFFTNSTLVFRISIVSTLTLCDFMIARFVSRRAGNFWGLVFFLNPISLIISGYHNQFDNIALLFASLGIACICESSGQKEVSIKDFAGVFLLSLSMMTKHIMFALPLWILLNKNIDGRKKFLYAFIPPVIFGMSFLPYCPEGARGIIRNVFLYKSFNNFPLLGLPIINHFGIYLPLQGRIPLPLFLLLMLTGAYISRKEKLYESFLLYTIALVCFSSAIANQYVAIPCMAVILLMRRKSVLYFLQGLAFLLCNTNGLHIPYYLQEHYGIAMNFVTKALGDGVMYTLFAWCLLYYLLDYYHHKKL